MLLNDIIKQDIFRLLFSIHYKFNIPLNELLKKYIPEISIEKKKPKRTRFNNKKKPRYKFTKNYQCRARCWGGKESVKYNVKTKTWTYGYQCSHQKFGLYDYCKLHLKQFKKNGYPDHGNFDEVPPHLHYYKYKKKIEKRFKIKNT